MIGRGEGRGMAVRKTLALGSRNKDYLGNGICFLLREINKLATVAMKTNGSSQEGKR